ncbi:hypothetical protein [Hymenobacter siberiensis]|uniref:hypothetical protein n=1 Tax=Hymenobacter siberiensis TaxID=2848396 RepID=UPI001C1E8265|nr:hypothetical protein [Hymenobacter siberiensis]
MTSDTPTEATVAIDLPTDYEAQLAVADRPDRRNPITPGFDWQVVPETLKTDDPAGYQRIRLSAMLDVMKFEVSDLPFQNERAARLKMTNLANFIDNTKNYLRHGMPQQMRSLFDHWIDNLGAQGWNVLDSFFKAKDQRVFLHVVNLYNAGMLQLPGMDKPLNQATFAEVQAAEDEEERLYWKHQQRLGLFLPLTIEDVKATVLDENNLLAKPVDELTLDDFKLAAKAIDKAVLIAYEHENGVRKVLKDLTATTPEAILEPELATTDAE